MFGRKLILPLKNSGIFDVIMPNMTLLLRYYSLPDMDTHPKPTIAARRRSFRPAVRSSRPDPE
jgi:hypothetical protein